MLSQPPDLLDCTTLFPTTASCLQFQQALSLFLPIRADPLFPYLLKTRPHGEHNNPHLAHRLSSLAPTKSWILSMSPLLDFYTPIPRENTTITPNDAAINSWFPTSTGLLMLLAKVSLSVFSLILHNDHILFLKTLTHYYSH